MFQILIFICFIPITFGQWILSNKTLPRAICAHAVGSYNGSIFMIGGIGKNRNLYHQMMEYHINTNAFIDHGEEVLQSYTDLDSLFGWGQFYAQYDDMIYMLHAWNHEPINYIARYQMSTNDFDATWKNTQQSHGEYGCLAISSHYLFAIGGKWPPIATVEMLNLSTFEWMNNIPSLNKARRTLCCIVTNDILWAFGGVTGENTAAAETTNTGEYMNITQIHVPQSSWQYTMNLTVALEGSQAVLVGDYIYIIGGRIGANWNDELSDKIHRVDIQTRNIILLEDRLLRVEAYAGAIMIDNVIYILGGIQTSDRKVSDRWMYLNVSQSTLNRTAISTNLPTTRNVSTAITTANDRNDHIRTPTKQQDAKVRESESTTEDRPEGHNEQQNVFRFFVENRIYLIAIAASLCVAICVVRICIFCRIQYNKAIAAQIASELIIKSEVEAAPNNEMLSGTLGDISVVNCVLIGNDNEDIIVPKGSMSDEGNGGSEGVDAEGNQIHDMDHGIVTNDGTQHGPIPSLSLPPVTVAPQSENQKNFVDAAALDEEVIGDDEATTVYYEKTSYI